MKRLKVPFAFLLTLTVAVLIAAPRAHAQDSTSVVVETPAPPPPAYGQPAYHQRDWRTTVAVGVTRQLTQQLTNNGPAKAWTTDSTGFLAQIRSTPFWGAGTEINYGYTQLTEQYRVAPGVFGGIPTSAHELTGAFVFESHMHGVKPFLSLGGGAIDFVPLGNQSHQWRGAGLAEFGFDIPAGHHWGVRVQGRSLFYRTPNFNISAAQSREWVATVEPGVSLYARF